MDAVEVYLSPLGLAVALGWNFAVLASIQLTVRLIRAFSLRTTALAALLLTGATVPITIGFNLVLRNALSWLPAAMPAAMLVTGAVGFLIAARVLRFRRRRSTVVAAIGIGLLSGPWGAFLVRPP